MRARSLFAGLVGLLGLAIFSTPAVLAQQAPPPPPPPPGSVTGVVYYDANVNGRPDTQERAVKNIQLDLVGLNYRESRKTANNGTFEFLNVPPGLYKIMVKLPNGFGLSTGEPKELILDGRTAVKLEFGVARADQLPTPTPIPWKPPVTYTPTATSTPVPSDPSIAISPGGSTSDGTFSVPRPGGPSSSGSSASAPTPRPAEPTLTPLPTATLPPTSTPTPTPTRTPPAVEGQQAAAERAQAALESPGAPFSGSSRSEDDVLLDVPYRSALDGSEYSDTNSGSAALAMALESYGFNVATADLRSLANVLSRTYDVSQPPRLEVLTRLSEIAGLRGLGVFQGIRLAVWSVDDVKARVKSGHPVLTQIRPPDAAGEGEGGRERFVLIIGLKDGNFIYHDPSYPDGRGARRTLVATALTRAWANGPNPAQAAGLAMGAAELGLFATPAELAAAQRQERPVDTAREAPTMVAQAPLVEGIQLVPLQPAPQSETVGLNTMDSGPSPWQGLPGHPLLLSFWVVAGAVLVRVVGSLILN